MMIFQVAKVNKMLASIAGICDNGNTVTFTDQGGYIRNVESGRRTTFERKGNVYILDMWVRHPGAEIPSPSNKSGFIRPEP